jgi:hypothetical protein
MYGIDLGTQTETMHQKDLFEALVRGADSDAADNEPKRDADIEGDLLREAFVTFSGPHDFKPGMIVAGCSLLRKSGNGFFLILDCAMMNRCLISKRVTGPLGMRCCWIC